jgi:rsbT co-antagonist protein RsbR
LGNFYALTLICKIVCCGLEDCVIINMHVGCLDVFECRLWSFLALQEESDPSPSMLLSGYTIFRWSASIDSYELRKMSKLQTLGCHSWNARAGLIDYHSTIAADVPELTLAQIISENKEDVLVSWKKMLLKYGGQTRKLMTIVEFDKEAKAFLTEFVNAIQSKKYGDITLLEFEGLLGFLRKFSREGAKQGVLPSDIATFVFCLKYVLTDLMQNYFKDSKELNNEITAVYRLLDSLGLYTFDTYSKTRENLITQQKRAISLLQEARASRMLLKVDEGIVALPIMGMPDDEKHIRITKSLLEYIAKYNCRVVILDLTNISSFSLAITKNLMNLIKSVKLLEAKVIITGIKPEMTKALSETELNGESVPLFDNLKDGILHATQSQEMYTR